jgi:hypothetical protein
MLVGRRRTPPCRIVRLIFSSLETPGCLSSLYSFHVACTVPSSKKNSNLKPSLRPMACISRFSGRMVETTLPTFSLRATSTSHASTNLRRAHFRRALDAEHAGALVADRIDSVAERAVDQAPQKSESDAAQTLARADYSHTVGREDRVERMPFRAQDIVCLVLGGAGSTDSLPIFPVCVCVTLIGSRCNPAGRSGL